MDTVDQYIMFMEYGGRRQYVSGTSPNGFQPRFTNEPNKAMRVTRQVAGRIDRSTPEYLQIEPWSPALQEMIRESSAPVPEIHYAYKTPVPGQSIPAVCGMMVYSDSVTSDMDLVTCDHCLRWKAPESGRDVAKGRWPIKGRYFNHDIRTLPASYWVWVIDKTGLISESSYLYDYFKKHESTLRRRAKLKI